MPTYVDVEDVREIARLNRELGKQLRASLPHRAKRTIGYPLGSFEATVNFAKKSGADVFWWCPGGDDGGTFASNFIGRGTPGEKKSVNIDVQFNLPLQQFSRTRGGAFIKDKKSEQVFLAHRGIATLGHARARKDLILGTIDSTLCDVETSDGHTTMIRIASLGSSRLVTDIAKFARELRRTVQKLAAKNVTPPPPGPPHGKAAGRKGGSTKPPPANAGAAPSIGLAKLKKYLDEFRGKVKVQAK